MRILNQKKITVEKNKILKVIISGGGTGGHVFPAIAIANTLKRRVPDIEILFVGAKGRMEMEKVAAAGYTIEGLWISGIQRRLTFKNFSVPFKIISSLLKSKRILKKFRPDVVVGVGGYASWAIVKMASMLGIPTLIQEQNSYPGKSNIDLSKKVDRICVAFEGMEKFFPASKIVVTGNPVRLEMVDVAGKKEVGLNYFKLSPDKKVVLVIGGSLGARTINDSIGIYLEQFLADGLQLIWQTGKSYKENVRRVIKPNQYSSVNVNSFISCMDLAYAAADIVISRAGAISISELCIVGKPVILVPSPNVAEDHQTKNAMALVNSNAAILLKDSECREKLGSVVKELIGNNELCKEMSSNLKQLALPDAADSIVNEVLKLAMKN
jgi:UDP-N-acetylglucosamine--N-acetylmuramyl-(pentapeptide) pyrophosphoryl-undecaprenol N-acetylglucosamine transferase